MQTACARAWKVLAAAPLDYGNVNSRQHQLARQHQPCRASSGDHHLMLCMLNLSHGHPPVTGYTSHTPSDITPPTIAISASSVIACSTARHAVSGSPVFL